MSEGMMLISDIRRGLLVSNLRARLEALAHLPGILGSRIRIQKRRKVAVATVDTLLVHTLPPLQRLRFERLGLMRRKK
jgi:hypothetical protein